MYQKNIGNIVNLIKDKTMKQIVYNKQQGKSWHMRVTGILIEW